ncbi:uncharacterized protein LOC129786558 [Lutzomyia longipalpis]|uniref:uncharacterized protein LOC129786558 n=1 Tax=Lutzomyia longipalpis TaxID=7200 RepID=UPI002484552F|nr:uncharacterized protein LOC129786558 [Lutzomyia longipalpis]
MENEERDNESASSESKNVRDVQEAVDSQTEDLKSLEVPTEGITLSEQKANTDLPEVTESDLKETKEEIPNKAEEPEIVQNSMEVPVPAEEEEKTVIPPDQAEKSQKREQDESKNIPEKEQPSLKPSKERKSRKSKVNHGTSSSEYIPGHFFKLELIRIVKNYPCIYNKNHDHFKDLQAKKAAWRKISNKLSIKMKICIVTFRDLLERFSAIYESSEASQSSKDVSQGGDFPYYKEMLYIMEETVQEEVDVNEKRVGKKRKKEKKKKSGEEKKDRRIEGATSSCPDKELAGSSKEQPQERGTEAPPAAAEGDDDDVILIDPVVDSIVISSDEESGNLPMNENKKENPTVPPQKTPIFDINVPLIRAVKDNPCLYNPQNGNYLNRTIRTHTWYKIARQLGAIPNDCQERFLWLYKNFLDYFVMENIHSQIPIDPARKFPYYEEMLFVTASLDVPPSLGSPGYLCTQQEEFILRESIWRSIKVFTDNSVPLRSEVNAFQARQNQQRWRLPNKKNQRVRHPSAAEVPAKRFKKNPVLQQPRLVTQNSQAKVQEGETEKMDVDEPENGTSVSENSAQVGIPNVNEGGEEGGGNAKEPPMETKDDPDEISLENTAQGENPNDGDSPQDKDQATEEGNQTKEEPKNPIDGAKDSENEASDGSKEVQSLDENSKEEDKAEDPANVDANDQKTNHPDDQREPSDNFNVQLIRAVKSNPCLYDIQNSFYLNPFFADRIWDEIAQELRTTRHDCKKAYSRLFGKFKDNFLETLQGKQSEQFVYYNEMIFLVPYIIQNYSRVGQQQEGGCLGNDDVRFCGQSSAGNNAPRWKPIWPGNTTFASIRSLAQNSQTSQNETTTNTAGTAEMGAEGKRDEEKMSSSTATSTSQPNESDQSIQDAESSPNDTEEATKQGEMNENQESRESQGKENVEEAQGNAENSPERILQDHASIELFFKSIMQQVKRSNLTEQDFIDLQLAVINALATTLNKSSKN